MLSRSKSVSILSPLRKHSLLRSIATTKSGKEKMLSKLSDFLQKFRKPVTMGEYNQLYKEVLTTVVKYSIMTGFTFLAATWVFNYVDSKTNSRARLAKKKAAHKLEILGKSKLKLTDYELLIASNVVIPSDIEVSWKDIAGLESVIEEIKETVIFPIINSKFLTSSKLTKAPKGVLLYGPAGCGKTSIAKATAKQAATTFINLDVSMLTDKWYGESQKLVSAVFSLAEKLQPTIIFIDEIDSILRARSSYDHEATAMMKAQFMLLWDGLGTDPDKVVIVMGATNRPQDIDNAILRRMPATFKIPLPNPAQRKQILELILKGEKTEDLDYDYLVQNTAEFSGSDLKETCRIASLYRIRELSKKMGLDSEEMDLSSCELRPITMEDMKQALSSFSNRA